MPAIAKNGVITVTRVNCVILSVTYKSVICSCEDDCILDRVPRLICMRPNSVNIRESIGSEHRMENRDSSITVSSN